MSSGSETVNRIGSHILIFIVITFVGTIILLFATFGLFLAIRAANHLLLTAGALAGIGLCYGVGQLFMWFVDNYGSLSATLKDSIAAWREFGQRTDSE
jgi:hypothetical protein